MPRLPLEIWMLVVAQLDAERSAQDCRALASVALLCRVLAARTQPELFRAVYLRNEQQCARLSVVYTRSPHLADHARQVMLSGHRDAFWAWLSSPHGLGLVAYFARAEHVQISGLAVQAPPWTAPSLGPVLRRMPQVESIAFSSCFFHSTFELYDALRFLARPLKNLVMSRMRVRYVEQTSPRFDLSALSALNMHAAPDLMSWMAQNGAASVLCSLTLQFQTAEEMEAAALFIRQARRLQRLELGLPDATFRYPFPTDLLYHSQQICLRYLHELTDLHFTTIFPQTWSLILAILTTLPPDSKLTKLTLTRTFGNLTAHTGVRMSGLEQLDTLLAQPPFSHLSELTIRMWKSSVTHDEAGQAMPQAGQRGILCYTYV